MGRTSTGNPKGIVSLKRTSGSYVIGKIQVLKEHYERLGRVSVHYQFDDSWKEHEVEDYSEMSYPQSYEVLDS